MLRRLSCQKAAQGEGFEVAGIQQGEADEFVALLVVRVFFGEKLRFGVAAGGAVVPSGFEVSLRLRVVHDAALGQVVRAEAFAGELVHQALDFGRGGGFAVGVVLLAEHVEIAVGAVAFHNQQPVKRDAGLLGLGFADEFAPCQRQGLAAPVFVADDGVARKDGADGLVLVFGADDFEGGEADGGVAVLQDEDLVFFLQIALEQLGAGAAVVGGVESVELGGLDFA